MAGKTIDIKNRSASFEYAFIDRYVAGIQLRGSEVKSIREGKAIINDAFCLFVGAELFIRNMHIAEFRNAGSFGHPAVRDRKLLLTAKELRDLSDALKNKGLTVIPLRLFINPKGFAKLEIALAKGKKAHDKRETIKKRESDRELRRNFQ